jgi:hypothetical protein
MSNWVNRKTGDSDSFYLLDPEAVSKFYGGFSAGIGKKKVGKMVISIQAWPC